MIITAHSLNIKELEKVLLESIRKEAFSDAQLQLSCLLQDDNLVILLHSSETILRQKANIWRVLRQNLLQQEITRDVLVYLILQEKQPPQIITHTINLSGSEAKSFNPSAIARKLFKSDTASIIVPQVSVQNTDYQLKKEGKNKNFYAKNLLQNLANNRQAKLVTGGGIGLLLLLTLGYALSRPCVLGRCEVIPQAQELGANSAAIFTQKPTLEKLVDARQQLLEAIKILNAVPLWSSYYKDANNLRGEYQKKLQQLEGLILGLNFAKQAHTMTSAPLPVAEWEEVKVLWQNAIGTLQTLQNLPANDTSAFIQTKVKEYQANVNYINQQIKLEQKSLENLKSAQEAIKIAEARQSVSQTLANWQLVEATWRTAIAKLKAISPTTTSYGQGKELLTKYEPKLLESLGKKSEQERAINAYDRAIKEAKLAKDAELLNQWSVSVAHWRNAVTYIKQIPVNSFQYTQAQPLINSYTKSFEESQGQLRAVLKLQNANNELQKICSGTTKICNYVISGNTIQVHLTPTYVQEVWQGALEAKAQGNVNNQVKILNHISILEKNLETISKNTGIAVEVYNSDEALMLTYQQKMEH
jgi:hypothetical protein